MTALEPRIRSSRKVAVLHWPANEAERQRLVAMGAPRVLVVATGSRAPERADAYERHIRAGSEAEVLLDAITSLQADAVGPPHGVPYLDDDGLLWCGGRWVAVTEPQIPVVQLILANVGRLTRRADIVAAYRTAGGSATPTSLTSLVHRVARRFAAVGLDLHIIRGRGVLLTRRGDPGPGQPA